MNAVKGIYHNGVIELLEKPALKKTEEVLIIFPEKKKKIAKIGGLFKGCKIDYGRAERDLKKLSKQSERHLVEESGG